MPRARWLQMSEGRFDMCLIWRGWPARRQQAEREAGRRGGGKVSEKVFGCAEEVSAVARFLAGTRAPDQGRKGGSGCTLARAVLQG